jgi:hypothetical protein
MKNKTYVPQTLTILNLLDLHLSLHVGPYRSLMLPNTGVKGEE